jgi:repressor of nif and glnA expression
MPSPCAPIPTSSTSITIYSAKSPEGPANMIKQEGRDEERKEVTILKILKDSREPVGSRLISHRLKEYGIHINERAVRYHLRAMDELGLTHLVSRRRGRLVTSSGIDELDSALVGDRLGSAMTNIEMLICRTSFGLDNPGGEVPVNVSVFSGEDFSHALDVMKSLRDTAIFASDLSFIAGGGDDLGDFRIPGGKAGMATLSNVTVSAVLLKAGIPLDFKFAGVLQVRDREYHRFVDLIEYTGSSLSPFEVFLTCKMASVSGIARDGNGKILASFCELPSFALPRVEALVKKLEGLGIHAVSGLGRIGETLCGIPVSAGKVGMILTDGLNLVAAAAEAGIEAVNCAGCTVLDFTSLRPINDIQKLD